MREPRSTYLTIPIELSRSLIEEGLEKEFKFLIAMKSMYGGQVRNTKEVRKDICELLQVSEKTYYNRLNRCKKLNWIGTDNEWLFIRGFRFLLNRYQIKSKTCAKFDLFHDLKDFKEFCFSSNVQYLIKYQQKRLKLERQKAGSIQGKKAVHSSYFGDYALSLTATDKKRLIENYGTAGATILHEQIKRPEQRYRPGDLGIDLLADHFGRSRCYVRSMKAKSNKKYLAIKKNRFIKLDIPTEQAKALKKHMPEIANKVRFRKESIYMQIADNIKSDINLKLCRK